MTSDLIKLSTRDRISGINVQDLLNNKGVNFELVDEDRPLTFDSDDEETCRKEDLILRSKGSLFKDANLQNITFGIVQESMGESFEEIGALMDDILPGAGIKKKITRPGNGIKVPPNAKVFINYTIIGENDDTPLDINTSRGKGKGEFSFVLGRGEVIPVLDIGVATMELNELANFMAIPQYAYGKMGCPPRIRKDLSILAKIELVNFIEIGATIPQDIYDMSEEEQEKIPFCEFLKEAKALKAEGNKFFNESKVEEAAIKYKRALKLLYMKLTMDKNEDTERNELIFILNLNMAQAKIDVNKYERAIRYLKEANKVPNVTDMNKLSKLNYRFAVALLQTGKTEESLEKAKKALTFQPYNEKTMILIEKIQEQKKKDQAQLRALSKRIFSSDKSIE